MATRSADDLHRLAVELCISGRYARALRVLAQASGRTGDPDLLARIEGTRALALQRTGSPAEAEEVLREALSARGLTAHTRAILRGQLGALAMYGGRLDEAERLFGEATASLDDADPLASARVRMNRSLGRMQRRDLGGAAADAEWAATRFAAAGLATDEAHARHNLGYIALLSGDLVTALDAMLTARPAAATTPVAGAVGDMDRAEVLREAGQTTEAERLLERVAAVFGAHRMPQSRAEAEFQLARSLLAHDPERARRVALAASRRFQRLGNEVWAHRAEAIRWRAQLQSPRAASGEGTTRRVEEVAVHLTRAGFRGEATALRLTAAVADPALDGRRLRVGDDAPLEVRLITQEVKAARAARRGRHGEVRRHAGRGIDTLASWTGTFGSLDLQTSAAMHGARLMYAGLDAALHSRDPEIAFAWAERARHLSQQSTPLRPPPDPQLAAELAELRTIRAERPGIDWLDDPRAAELRERARRRQWAGTLVGEASERTTLQTVREVLGADTAVLSFLYTGAELGVLVSDSEGDSLVRLDDPDRVGRLLSGLRADLDMSAAVRWGPMVSVVQAALRTRLAELDAGILDPALARTDRRRLVLTVPGILSGVPWGMLPSMEGRVFTTATSATRWVRAMRATPAVPGRGTGFVVGPGVPRGEEEVARAGSAWSASATLLADRATVRGAAELAASSGVLHVAAHGRHTADNPLFSGLELTDGVLFGYDIDLIPDVPRVVVLSACEVGRSSVRWGEEALGMARIWLHGGADSVVAAPVRVADDDACELLAVMHEGLAAGEAPAEALAAAARRTGIRAPFQVHGRGF
ncbi:tetratricopeptide (TPR) repeat protein [Microbacterium sp. AK009]|uniref:CHAT domain-containing protein n=1 Tax=Microbacterium sp. AK009 TaxID=2723068 RepID=UPI00179F0923|nr:CHAT domain-containing protein [Microbacterium sp. AK009]NYF16733.1 tetratricopeptide (TPR) repeat protein [Microbacterium sp. AK009]